MSETVRDRAGVFPASTRDLGCLLDEVDADDAAHVLWHFGHRDGRAPGQFTASLLRACGHAGPGNLALLAQGFPGLIRAFTLAATEPFGMDLLAAVAQGGA